MKLPKTYKEDNCLYLTQDISNMNLYDKSKAIINFCDKETKIFEKQIDSAILEIFDKYKINVPNTDKKVLKLAFALLKAKGIEIEIKDLYEKNIVDTENYYLVNKTKNGFTIMLEDNNLLQCGVKIIEKKGKVVL